jgi:DinB superfamily
MNTDEAVRNQLLALLRGGNAHMGLDEAAADFPIGQINRKPPNVPYTPWHLLEHIRIAQWDILEFIRDPGHVSPEWPVGYWPSGNQEADAGEWAETIRQIRMDLEALQEIVADPATDLYAPMPQGDKYNILREILTVADHTAYHIGEFAILRQVMGTWGKR